MKFYPSKYEYLYETSSIYNSKYFGGFLSTTHGMVQMFTLVGVFGGVSPMEIQWGLTQIEDIVKRCRGWGKVVVAQMLKGTGPAIKSLIGF